MNSSHRLRYIVRVFVLGLLFITPALAQMKLISEERSVTVSYYGSGIGTTSSAGTFGLFEASAVGVPFGGGYMTAYQKSDITASEINIYHYLDDNYGPGGFALSSFAVTFSLLQDTRLTITGYCSNFSGSVSLGSDSSGDIPLIWHNGPGDPPGFDYRNFLDFDQVLAPGTYSLFSSETPRDAVSTTIKINASPISDGGSSALFLAVGVVCAIGVHRRMKGRLSGME